MYLRRCHRRKNGKDHEYWALVESIRTARGPRQRVVSYLGELSANERQGWARLGAALDGKAESKARQLGLFEPMLSEDSEPVPDTLEVRIKGVRVKQSRAFGEIFLGLLLWRMLGLDEFFEKELPPGEEGIRWALLACLLAIGRFVHPSSELHLAEKWYERTALPELLGIQPEQVYHTRLYRTLDKVLPLKPRLEAHLKERYGELFQPDYEILLYDVTSTYFEGEAKRNPQAQRGYSRDHRPDCKQVCIALVVTVEGFPLGYEIFAGNHSDVTTVEEIVESVEMKYGRSSRIWVMDRGMVSEDNLEFLQKRHGRYLVGTPKSLLKKFEKELLEKNWCEVQAGVEVKLVNSPDGEETYVLCRSAARVQKEKAIHQRFLERIETGLRKLSQSLESGKKKRDPSVIERQIGRLLGKNSRVAKAFDIQIKQDSARPSGLRLEWVRLKEWEDWAVLSEGCYLLRTNLTGHTPEALWKLYIQLTDIEDVFRIEKSDLKIRPIWHQLEERGQAHILFSFLAYALWKTLQTWMDRSGLGRGVSTVLDVFSAIKASDVHLPTTDGREVRLACITLPDKPQRAIIDRLGVLLPERLGRPQWIEKLQEL